MPKPRPSNSEQVDRRQAVAGLSLGEHLGHKPGLITHAPILQLFVQPPQDFRASGFPNMISRPLSSVEAFARQTEGPMSPLWKCTTVHLPKPDYKGSYVKPYEAV